MPWSCSPGGPPAEDHKHVRAGQAIAPAGTGESTAATAQGADGQEAHGAAHAGHGDRCQTQVGERVCKWT